MRYFILRWCLLGLLISCTDVENLKDLESAESEAVFAFPLLNSKLSMSELLDDLDEQGTLLVDPDGLLRFFYRGDTTVRNSDEIFDRINRSLPPIIPVSDTLIGFPTSSSEFDVEKIVFKGGRLEYSFFNNNSNSVEIVVTLPQISKNGVPLSQTHNLLSFSTLPLQFFDLKDATFIPRNDSLFIQYQAKQTTGTPVKVSNFLMVPKNFDYYYAEGFLGSQIFESDEDTLDIDYYDSWTDGEVAFKNPRVIINILNSFGFPAIARVERFDVITLDNTNLPIESAFVKDGFPFNYPTFQEIGQVKTSTFVFDTENSNMEDIIRAGPTALIYDLDAISDPNVDARGFITDSSYFAYSVDAEFPFEGSLQNFTIRDTSKINFEELEKVKTASLKTIITNGVPLGATVQGYFLDDKGKLLDSLFTTTTQLVAPARVNTAGSVTQTEEKTTFVELDEIKLNRIRNATNLVIEAVFSTANEGSTDVKIFSTQSIQVRIGMKIGL